MQGAGLFSSISGYVKGMGMGAARAWGGMGARNRASLLGALGGAAYGAMSSDTSVLGGAAMGAGLGRYGYSGMRAGARTGAGLGMMDRVKAYGRAFGMGAAGSIRRDYRGARVFANQGYTKIRGLWRR